MHDLKMKMSMRMRMRRMKQRHSRLMEEGEADEN